MRRSARLATVLALMIFAMAYNQARAVNPVNTVQWIGAASGNWNDANAWKNTTTNTTGTSTDAAIFAQNNGSDGMNDINPATTRARNIVIGGGAVVTYPRAVINSDFRAVQGTTLTIKEGGVWQQVTDNTYSENGWTQIDVTKMTLDNGTFRRSGVSPAGDGGGIVLFGSYRDDANIARLGPPRIAVEMKNGGKIENNGQLWFGADDEHTADVEVGFTINNGSMDLTGGTIPQTNSTLAVAADLAFFYDYSEVLARPKNEQWSINFTGPGSITVDTAGIWVYNQDSGSIWTGGQKSYQNLWDLGILKANGLSGQTGTVPTGNGADVARQPANFSDFFSVTGTPGTNDYKVTATANTTIATVEWVGAASGNWNDANAWKNTTTNTTGTSTDAAIFAQNNGSDGMNDINPATTRARNIVIGGGAVVTYPRAVINSDFRAVQGTTLTIKEGGVWQQVTDNTYSENGWTQIDVTKMTLDNGTFRRSGVSPAGDGGGIVLFGSYRDDANIARLGPPRIAVEMKNGGKIENNGQLWFGADDEHTADVEVGFTINNGSMDLTGGTIPQTNSTLAVAADLAFFYDYSEVLARPKNEQWSINFTGPGSITVDTAGIWVYNQDSGSIWTGGQKSYQNLWDLGILKANGLSGQTGTVPTGNGADVARQPANFSDFFSVTGTPGTDNYILTSLITAPPTGVPGDYNGNGIVDGADYVLWRNGGPLLNEVDAPGTVNAADYTAWRARFGNTSGSGAGLGAGAVPEPGAAMLMLVGSVLFFFRKRRVR